MNSSLAFLQSRGLALFSAAVITLAAPLQAREGLVVLYTFEEGSGTIVRDVSGVGDPLDLTIGDASAVDWLPDGGLAFKSGVLAASPGPAAKVIEALQATGSMTVEAWVKPTAIGQTGPARMVTVSATPGTRNFTLGQQHGSWAIRVRGPGDGNGIPQMPAVPPDAAAPLDPIMFTELRPMHVVYTRDFATGTDTIYVDGQWVIDRVQPGDFSGWDQSFRFALAGELDNSRFWLGEMYRVAIYDRAWTAEEVLQQFQALTPSLEITDVAPATGTLFHPAAEGIRFRVVAAGDNTVAQEDVRLTLNGQDRSGDLQFTGGSSDWQVSFTGLEVGQTYAGQINVTDSDGTTRTALLVFETHALREDGLLVLYTFEEGGGSVIQDVAEAGPPLNLNIEEESAVRWLEGGGLAIESPVRIASSSMDLATKITQVVPESNALTLEAWIRSTDPSLEMARVVTISEFRTGFPGSEADNSLRNLSLLQEGDTYAAYLRTTETDDAGRPPLVSDEQPVAVPRHVVYTRDADGQTRLYVNGVETASGSAGGDMSNWLPGYRLGLGTELNAIPAAAATHPFRRWAGEFYRVAVYHRALSAAEVTAKFEDLVGEGEAPPVPQNVQVQAGAVFAHISWEPSTAESGRVFYDVERDGEIIASFIETTGYLDRDVAPSSTHSYRVRALDFLGTPSDFSPPVAVTTGELTETPGLVRAEFYTGISGNEVTALTQSAKFPHEPDATLFLPSLETPRNWGDNYGVQVTGWFVPPETGDYVFFMSSDHDGEFWLSTDDTPGSLMFLMFDSAQSAFRDWTGTAGRPDQENRSDLSPWVWWPPPISLVQGQRYYFQALMKEGTGPDHLSVTYKLAHEPDPENGSPSRMIGDVIQTLGDPDFVPPAIAAQPQGRQVQTGGSVTLTVEVTELSSAPLSYQWRRDGQNIPGATGPTYTIASFQQEDAGIYSVVVSNLAGSVTSASAVLILDGLAPGTVPGEGLVLHLDASSLNLADGAPVSVWPDLSGAGHNAVQPDDSRFPVLVAAASPSGLPVVRFEGTPFPHLLVQDMGPYPAPNTIFLVWKINEDTGGDQQALDGATEAARVRIGYQANPSRIFAWSGGGFPNLEKSMAVPFDAPILTTAVYDTAGGLLRVDGVLEQENPTGDIPISGFTLGRRVTDAQRLVGDIAELIVYNRRLSEIEIFQVEEYLTAKWFMPVVAGASLSIGISEEGLIVIEWADAQFQLQSAPGIDGPWNLVPDAVSPFQAEPAEASQFYRLLKPE